MKFRVTEPLRQHRLEHEARQRQWRPPDREAPRSERGGQGQRHVAPGHDLDGTGEVRDAYGNPTLEASLDQLHSVPRARSWAEVFAQPTEVTVEAFVTGHASGDRRIVLDREDPNIRHLSNPFEPSAVLAYLVHHPRHGYFLVDAGLSRTFTDGGGNYSAPLRKLLSTIGVETRQSPGEDLASQLRGRGVVPHKVLLTHLHEDHTSGLADLDCGVPVVFGAGEGPPGDHFTCRTQQLIDFRDAEPMLPFDHVVDVFGDGTFWAIATPGHSPGHISYLVIARGGPILITGDAAAYRTQLAHRIRPAPGVFDPDAAARSLDQLATLTERFPRLRVAVGHETPL